jgi:MFS transporter, BCD family, chlorophyll transporter
MLFRKRIQLALVHVAVAMTLVPINSTLNRVMIKEMAISATVVAILASLPYLFSPLQVVIGSYSDRHPLLGLRRTPYIALGLLLCVIGVSAAPHAVFLLPENLALGITMSILSFGAWGMGFNFASVSYLSLASELSGEKGRSQTVSIMWFLMIIGIILTAAGLARMLEPYSHEALERAFGVVGMAALALGILGLLGLEPRQASLPTDSLPERHGWKTLISNVLANRVARYFFFYLIIMLAAILGQDVLLEPFAGQALGLPVAATTRITSIWGGCVLITLLVASWLETRIDKRSVARMGAWGAIAGFIAIAASGLFASSTVFYTGVVLLGLGTGLATVSNLSLMLDMTSTNVGLYIGAWGLADALARLLGSVMGGVVRDIFAYLSQNPNLGYMIVFLLEAALLAVSLVMLNRIDVQKFRSQTMSVQERAAMLNEVSS